MDDDNPNDPNENEIPEDDWKRANRELAEKYAETIRGWAQALELRDLEEKNPPPEGEE